MDVYTLNPNSFDFECIPYPFSFDVYMIWCPNYKNTVSRFMCVCICQIYSIIISDPHFQLSTER